MSVTLAAWLSAYWRAGSHVISRDLDSVGRVNFFGSFRSDRSWERLHEENRDCRSEQAIHLSLDTTGHDSDESGRDERSTCRSASYVSYAIENLFPIPISDERGGSSEMAIDPALQQQSIPA